MNDITSAEDNTVEVRWEQSPHIDWANPMVQTLPCVELKLEHPDLDPTRYGESFFPDAVPYEFDGVHEVFYWRPTLNTAMSEQTGQEGVCATTDSLSVVPESRPYAPDLVSRRSEATENEALNNEATEVVVGGTIAGDSTTTLVRSYSIPDVRIQELSASRLELLADGTEYVVSSGTRRHISLSEQTIKRADGSGGTASVAPELIVRFPGERELHHPAPDAEYRLFPSFGLELDAVPNPVPTPTTNDELDYTGLATSLGVDLSDRPYPERVLWQAFAYTAFDPHTDTDTRLTQFSTGHLGLRTGM